MTNSIIEKEIEFLRIKRIEAITNEGVLASIAIERKIDNLEKEKCERLKIIRSARQQNT